MRSLSWLVTLGLTACFSDVPGGGNATEDDASGSGSTGSNASTSDGSDASTDLADTGSSGLPSSESTAATEPECGNAVQEPGEDCDDGDDDDLDGCLANCRVGPIGIRIVDVQAPPPMGQNQVVVQVESCGIDRALATTRGWLGGPDMDNTWPVSHGGTCQQLMLTARDGQFSIVGTDVDPDLPEHGNTVGQLAQWSLQCPPGELPVGMRGRLFASTTVYLRSLALDCATPQVVLDDGPPRVVLSPPQTTDYTPSTEEGTDVDAICPPGSIVVGFQGSITARPPAVQDLGPLCGRLELVMP